MSRSFEQIMAVLPKNGPSTEKRNYDVYERSMLAMQQVQILLIAQSITKAEAFSMIKMINSKDKENLTLVELSIEKFLTHLVDK